MKKVKKSVYHSNSFLLHFWKGFLAVLFCYLLSTNQVTAFDTPMIELYQDMFSWISIYWLKLLSMWAVFLLLITSAFYQLHVIIKNDKEDSAC